MTDSLPQRMREAAKVLVEASERHHPGVDQSPPSSKLWSAMELCNLATHWEAEDRAKAEQDAMVEELARFMVAVQAANYPSRKDLRDPECYKARGDALDIARKLIESDRFEITRRKGGSDE